MVLTTVSICDSSQSSLGHPTSLTNSRILFIKTGAIDEVDSIKNCSLIVDSFQTYYPNCSQVL